jgi:protease-4
MALDSDALVDRRRLKRWLTIWRAAAIFALLALVLVAVGRIGTLRGIDHIARLDIDGIILNDHDRLDAVDRIADDHRVKALIVSIDSPGGTVVGGEALFRALRAVAGKKPVVAVMDETAASGGYMVALAADQIFAHEATITGSIGVIFQSAEVTELLAKLGITPQEIKSGPLKAQPSPFEKLTPEARRVTQEVVNDIYDMFVKMTADRSHRRRGRGDRLAGKGARGARGAAGTQREVRQRAFGAHRSARYARPKNRFFRKAYP